MTTLFDVRGVRTEVVIDDRNVGIVDDVSLSVNRGKTLCIVGESGCGKSMLALSLIRLLPASSAVTQGQILLNGQDLLRLDDEEMRGVRGQQMAMIFQEPMTSLNPVFTIGDQIAEAISAHDRSVSSRELKQRSIEVLRQVEMTDPARRISQYPHELSGGMRQRVMIAMALITRPAILIADEPTTALDVSVQAQILDLLKRLQNDTGMGIIFITHDLGVVSEIADDVAVMYAGRIVEYGTIDQIITNPQHPYTIGLLASVPEMSGEVKRLQTIRGYVPASGNYPSGCRFHPRCVFTTAECDKKEPLQREIEPGHHVACINVPLESLAWR